MEFLLIVALMVSSYAGSTANDLCNKPNDDFEPWKRSYLPETIQPVLYDLTLTPDFYYNASSFTGTVAIEFKVINATNTIILHQRDLEIINTSFTATTCAQMPEIHRTFLYNAYLVIQTNKTMDASNCTSTFVVEFRGNLADASLYPLGFFKSKYINDITGKESWLVATNLAGVTFPCFDEDHFKAPAYVTLIHWRNFTALSNMNIKRETNRSDGVWKITSFEKSPAMRVGAMSFFISDFAFKENSLSTGKQNRVWARPDRLDKMDYALKVSKAVDNYYYREFGIAYPFDKLEHVALPQFHTRGSAYWGFLSYIESILLVDIKKDGYVMKSKALELISHEMAHTYFGILIPYRGEDHFWLVEGFATFYSSQAMTEIEPTYFQKEIHDRTVNTMALEVDNQTRPLLPLAVSGIRYYKGAAILRMVKSFMGAANFKSGITRYIRDNTHKNAETSDLWAALQQDVNDSSLNLEEVMKTWVYKAGIPVVFVLPLPDNHFVAIQERFLSNRPAVQDCRCTWHIPLKYRTKGGSDGLVWVKDTYAIFNVSLDSPGDWILFNPEASGYYVVNYDNILWKRILNQLKEDHTVFSESTRLKLFSDAKILANFGHVGNDRFLSLTKYASEERGVGPWTDIVSFIDRIKRKTFNTASFSLFQRYTLNLTSSFMDELQAKDEGTDVYEELRPKIMSLSCSAGHRGCIENTTAMFKEWIKNQTKNTIPVEYQKSVFCVGVANSVLESDWNTVYERFIAAALKEERNVLIEVLTCSRNATLLRRLLEYAINDTRMKYDERRLAFSGIASNPASEDCVFEWLQLNYTEADVKVRKSRSKSMIYATANSVATREQRDKVLNFLKNYPFVSEDDIQYYLEIMEKELGWIDKNLSSIVSWLEHNVLEH